MNTEQMLKVINEITESETKYGFQKSINSILTYYQQNDPNQINALRTTIDENLQKTPSANYVNIDLKILEQLNVQGYFDLSLIDQLNDILSSQSHEVTQKLQSFINARQEQIQKITELKNALDHFNIPQDSQEDLYLVNLALPKKFHSLDELQKVTRDLDLFLATLTRATKSNSTQQEAYQIKAVGNGCIELFLQVIPELAEKVVDVLDIILRVQGAIELYNQSKRITTKYSAKNAKSAEKIAKQELDDEKKKLIEEYVKQLKFTGEESDIKDEKNRARNLLRVVVKYFEEGVSIEVKTPTIEKPKEPDEGDSEEQKLALKKQKKLFDQKAKIDEVNKHIYQLQKEGVVLELPDGEDSERQQ